MTACELFVSKLFRSSSAGSNANNADNYSHDYDDTYAKHTQGKQTAGLAVRVLLSVEISHFKCFLSLESYNYQTL